MEELPKLITVNEAAKYLNVNPNKLRRWVNQGLLAGVCLLPASRRQKLRIKQDSIDEIFAEAARQEARQRAYEKEAQERYDYQLDAFDWE